MTCMYASRMHDDKLARAHMSSGLELVVAEPGLHVARSGFVFVVMHVRDDQQM